MANVKATDLIDFTRASKGHALAKISYGSELVSSSDQNQSDTSTDTFAKVEVDPISVEVGKIYFVSATVTATSTGTFKNPDWGIGEPNIDPDQASTFDLLNEQDAYEDGVETNVYGTVIPNQSTIGVAFRVGGSSSGDNTLTVSNISVREVLFNQTDGTLQLFEHPNNIPRIEYDADGNLLGLLIEEARTNLIFNSSDFSVSSWAKSGSSISAATSITAPDGTTNSFKLTEDSSSNAHRVQGAQAAGGTTSTMSCFMKKAERSWGNINFAGLSNGQAWFDLENGVLGTVQSAVTARIEDYGNGWYRCSVTATPTSASTTDIKVANADDSIFYSGDGTSGIYVFGAQTEAGSFPTSYIKTTGSTASRSADVASIDVDQFGYNQSEGTMFVEYDSLDTVLSLPVKLEESGANTLTRVLNSSGNARVQTYLSGASQENLDLGSITSGNAQKVATAFKTNDFAGSLNGGTVATDASGTFPSTYDTLALSQDGVELNGHIKSINYYPKRLSNAKLQELTS